MVAEQLERSILERKERDELHAIATAMALKPAARLKKADIIDLILQATGVGPEAAVADGAASPAPDAPANGGPRRRPPRARAEAAADADADAGEAPAERAPTAEDDAAEAPAAAEADQGAPADGAPEVTTEQNGAAPLGDTAEFSAEGPAKSNGQGQSHQNGQGQGQRNQQNQQNQGGPGNQSNQGGQGGGQLDVGNRRGRRRRGRDRERVGGEGAAAADAPYSGELIPVKGLLDLRDEGYGFLRTSGYLASQRDVYVSVSQARRFALRRGDAIEGACRPAGASEKYPALVRIDSVGGMNPEEARLRPRFEDLTPLFPDEQLHLELAADPTNVTARIVDLISPIGKGQRGLIVSPPKAGKTTILKQIAHSIEANDPEVHLIVLLVDERPEEVTDMRRSVKGEVIASTFDRPADEHTAVAELTIERAKRLVELGKDVVIVLDGITRLARAYNLAQPATGRIMSGGVDSGALYPPKRFFGAARNVEEGGSLTILATALVETGSRMDEVIFEEFKGTGNMELRLDRKLSERRLYPSIDVNASSTRHEELLFDRGQLQQVWKLRRVLNALSSEGNVAAGLELLIDKLRQTRSNDEFLAEIAKAPVPNT